MSLVVSLSKVKDKCGLTGSTYDTKISALISDWLPAIEFAVEPGFIADTSNTGLQATLNLGATELISGEFLAQLAREPGGSDGLFFGWLELRPAFRDLSDPFGLKSQGSLRLEPFLKHIDSLQGSLGVHMGGSRTGEDE